MASLVVCADLSNDVDTVFISKNDKLYRPPYAREPNTTAYNNYQPYFICSVSDSYMFFLSLLDIIAPPFTPLSTCESRCCILN